MIFFEMSFYGVFYDGSKVNSLVFIGFLRGWIVWRLNS